MSNIDEYGYETYTRPINTRKVKDVPKPLFPDSMSWKEQQYIKQSNRSGQDIKVTAKILQDLREKEGKKWV